MIKKVAIIGAGDRMRAAIIEALYGRFEPIDGNVSRAGLAHELSERPEKYDRVPSPPHSHASRRGYQKLVSRPRRGARGRR